MSWDPLEQACRVGDDQLYLIDPWMGPWAIIRRLSFNGAIWYRAVTSARIGRFVSWSATARTSELSHSRRTGGS